MMQLEEMTVNQEKLYAIGFSPVLKKYILIQTVPHFAWYNRYYEITEKEFHTYGTYKWPIILKHICRDEEKSSRFLFSEKNEENTKEQKMSRDAYRAK